MPTKKTNMKIAVLCNSRMALPALQNLVNTGQVAAIGIGDNKVDVIQIFEHFAQQQGLPLCIFSRKNFGTQLREWLHEVTPDVVFVMTYPFRIPASALTIPKLGFINFHYGLLPEMRGADPVFEGIRQQRPVAGTTIHVMDAGYDTGPIIMREEIPCPPHFTYGMLTGQLAHQGADMCNRLLALLSPDKPVPATPQDESKAAYYPALTTEGIYLDWAGTNSDGLVALVNSCNPMSKNGVPTVVNGWTLGVCDASIINLTGDTSAYPIGAVLAIDPQNGLLVLAKDRAALKLEVVYIEEGYLPGYKLANFGIQPGMLFTGRPQ